MPNSITTQNVEISCKTLCKTLCILKAKLCANPMKSTTMCVKQRFFPHLFTHKPQAFTQARHLFYLTNLSTFPRTLLQQLQII